jgi:hypothetical protein
VTAFVARPLAGSPWARRQVGVLVAVNGVASILLLIGWGASAREVSLSIVIAWLNLGVGAVVIAAAADVAWLATGRRAVLARRRRIIADAVAVDTPEPSLTAGTTGWVHIAGASRAHRPDCMLVAGKHAAPVDPAALRAAGLHLRRCEVCAR